MPLSIEHISLDCHDAYALAKFWSEVLRQPMDPEDVPGAPEAGFDLPVGHDFLFFQVPEPKTVKNRMHLCLRPEGSLDDELKHDPNLGIVPDCGSVTGRRPFGAAGHHG